MGRVQVSQKASAPIEVQTNWTDGFDIENLAGGLEYAYGEMNVKTLEPVEYAHPSGQVSVRMARDSIARFSVDFSGGRVLVIEGTDDRRTAFECMGHRNPTVRPEDYTSGQAALEALARKSLNTLLMHAANYDGCDGAWLGIAEAEEQYSQFGISYLKHQEGHPMYFDEEDEDYDDEDY